MYRSLIKTALWGFGVFSIASVFISLFELFVDTGTIKNITLFGIPAFLSLYVICCMIHFVLLRRRRDHRWNIKSLCLTIDYLENDGSRVEIGRNEVIYPNHSEVRSVNIGINSSVVNGDVVVCQNNWTCNSSPGKIMLQKCPIFNVDKKWFRETHGRRLYIVPENGKFFPYPKFGLLLKKTTLGKFFRLEITGRSIYINSFMDNEEYLTFSVLEGQLIESIKFCLKLPVSWASKPVVKIYRIGKDSLESVSIDSESEREGNKNLFKMTLRNCGQEVLRLDWRRGENDGSVANPPQG